MLDWIEYFFRILQMAVDEGKLPPAVDLLPAASACFLVALAAWFTRRVYLRFPELPRAAEGISEEVRAIIPARDEGRNITRAVNSLRGVPVLVVDDHSSDGTAGLAAAAGACVLTAPPLAGRGMGKSSACWAGAQASGEKWLLFADADTWYEPEFAASAVRYAVEQDLTALSVFPRREGGGWIASVTEPYAFALEVGAARPARVHQITAREMHLNGQCVLVRRDAYEFFHGHHSVKGSVLDGWALGCKIKRHRMPYRMLRAEHLAHAERGGLRLAIEKDMLRGMRVEPRKILSLLFWSGVMSVHLPVAAAYALSGSPVTAAVVYLIACFAWAKWYRWRWQALLMPFAVWIFQYQLVAAAVRWMFGIPLIWKGRQV